MTDEQKRSAVKDMYPKSHRWAKRVDRMSDDQVFAIWVRNQQNQSKEVKEDEDDPDIPF